MEKVISITGKAGEKQTKSFVRTRPSKNRARLRKDQEKRTPSSIKGGKRNLKLNRDDLSRNNGIIKKNIRFWTRLKKGGGAITFL